MAPLSALRFDDTRVGQRLPATVATRYGGPWSWPKLAERYVQDWAGHGALIARGTPVAEIAADEVNELIGMVYARHLDDSHNIEVQVTGRTHSGAKLVDLIRVRLN